MNRPELIIKNPATLEDAQVQCSNLDAAGDKPYVLDDATVQRVIRCYWEQRTYVPRFDGIEGRVRVVMGW